MQFHELYLLSTYLKKWSYNDNRITLNYAFCMDEIYERNHEEMRLGSPVNMVNEFLNTVFHRAKEIVFENFSGDVDSEEGAASNSSNIILVNESEVKRKLSQFLGKILKEFNNNRRLQGRQRMISTRSLDFYYNDFEYEPLDDRIKFYVHLNRGANKINGELWPNAVDDLELALNFRDDDIRANKLMALSLTKLGRYEQALEHIRKYTGVEKTPENLSALAAAYMHLENFDQAAEVFDELEKLYSDSLLVQFGRAQIAYKQGKGYKQILDRIYKEDPEWLREKMLAEWDFRLPGYGDDEEHMWNAATAARYLGFERPFDLTKRAFNDEIPSYFDSEKGTIRFVKAELDHWVELNNRYQLNSEKYSTYEDRLTEAEKKKAMKKRGRKKKQETEEKAAVTEAEPLLD